MEDNSLQKRCEHHGLFIDRSKFFNIGNPEILQLFDGISRIISKKDPYRMQKDNGIDGLRTIHKLAYSINHESVNPIDNQYIVENPRFFYINISTFLTLIRFEQDKYYNYDLREPPRKILHPDKIRETTNTVPSTEDWSNIPYYPTTKEKREKMAKQLVDSGQKIPPSLVKQIQEDKMKELDQDVYNNVNKNTTNTDINHYKIPLPNPFFQQQIQNQALVQKIKSMNPFQKQQFLNQFMINKNNQQPNHFGTNDKKYTHTHTHTHNESHINPFSPGYAKYKGIKPRAEKSANIRLGVLF